MTIINSARRASLTGVSSLVVAFAMGPLAAGAQTLPDGAPGQAGASTTPAATQLAAVGVDDIVVTAERRSESLQRVPIAISAFTQESLTNQRIETGADLNRAVPNVNFAKSYYGGFNFQIRGIGSQLNAVAGDPGVALHINNVPLSVSRFFEAQFFDVQRIEVLRGPQGTLYGRNATGGVINVVTALPTDKLEAMVEGEIANYNSYRFQGMINLPLAGDKLGLRLAGSYLNRDGFGVNTYTGDTVNGRNLYSTRATLLARPVDGIEMSLVWQHFNESDDRNPRSGTRCVKDNGPASVGGTAVTSTLIRGYLSQGCDQTQSIYSANANGTPNSLGTINGYIAQNDGGLTNGDYFAGQTLSTNLNNTESVRDPQYRAKDDIFIFNVGLDFAPGLKATAITSYQSDHLRSSREFQGAVPNVTFADTPLTPGGYYTDPLLGRLNTLGTDETLTNDSRQITQEVRIDSSFHGRFNFSVGGIFIDYKNTQNVYTETNLFTYAADYFNHFAFNQPACAVTSPSCIYIEPSPSYQGGLGHNYFLSSSPYRLQSYAAFGEAYFNITDRLKVTLGGRYTSDDKQQIILPVELLTLGSGLPVGAVPLVKINNSEPTGRLAIDWRPDVGFTDDTLLYGVVSHGYKAGGLNPPASFTLRPPFAPEKVNAIEIGTKNTLLNRALTVNLTYFHYDYKDYQVAEIRDRTQQIQNIDAQVDGAEFESALIPVRDARLNLSVGYLKTRITSGAFVDPTNFTGGDPTLTLVRGPNASTCAVNTSALAAYLATNPTPSAFVTSVCPGKVAGLVPNIVGVTSDLTGHQLPNAPHWTVSAGAEYTVRFGNDWRATLRGDYSWQASSFARTYNRTSDYLRPYDNVNATLTIANAPAGWQAQAFVKNLFDRQSITNTFVTDQIVGLVRVAFVTEPRIFGLTLTKHFD